MEDFISKTNLIESNYRHIYSIGNESVNVSIRFGDIRTSVCITTNSDELYFRHKIFKYVHEFQNFCHPITNEELTLK